MNDFIRVTITWTVAAVLANGTEVLQSDRAKAVERVQRAASTREAYMRDKYNVGAIDTTCEVVS